MTNAFFHASGTEIARMIRNREVTSREVVEAHIRFIERHNPRINAMVVSRFSEARREANAADDAINRGDDLSERPLHGVPCSIKESIALQGMPITSGLVSRRGVEAKSDAPTVARLRAAGAIPLGVTNVSELCMWLESANQVYGRSNNPYNTSRIVGGSSGGEGAIVGAGAVPFGLGADVGGSIRLPAFFNGVFGHKPSPGLVPNHGQFPIPDRESGHRLLGTGPIARRAEDLFPLLEVLSGPHEGSGEALCQPEPSTVDISQLRVLVVTDDAGRTPVSGTIRDSIEDAATHLRSRGADVCHARFPRLRRVIEHWAVRMHQSSSISFTDRLEDGKPIAIGRELLAALRGTSPFTIPALGLALIEKAVPFRESGMDGVLANAAALRREILEALGPNGVMLYPTYPTVAPPHNRPLLWPIRFVYTAAINCLELPSTQIPMGLDHQGLPKGFQVISAPGGDFRTIAVALELEKAFGGWVPPQGSSAT